MPRGSFGSVLEAAFGAAPQKKTSTRRAAHRLHLDTLQNKLELGAHVATTLRNRHGEACFQACAQMGADGDDERAHRFPYGFWKYFVEEEQNLVYSNRNRLHCFRCFVLYVDRAALGGTTWTSMRDGDKPTAKRRKGGEQNASKSKGIGWALLQFFLDEVQVLRSRADSVLLLDHARTLRQTLVEQGWASGDLPKLDGGAGGTWLYRWRLEYGLAMRATGMQLKVLWSKVKSRCRTHLSNLYRLAYFWNKVHPGVAMHFLSLDQKPSWFNNSGHTGNYKQKGRRAMGVRENFAKSRERYTILTTVDSRSAYTPCSADRNPPHVFIMFKGKKDHGRIIQDLKDTLELPPWLHLQVQEFGSYREEDMLEALSRILPVAGSTTESMIILLDWYSAHRTDAVIQLIEERGHLVLWHGGGCTPFTQINDTHLHGILQRYLIRLENQLTHEIRTDMHLNFDRGIPTLSRADVIEVVKTAWCMVNHHELSRVGYTQTGPTLPLEGPIRRDQITRDLRTVLDEVDPPIGLQEMGTMLRDEAQRFVEAGYPERWSSWVHAKRLIAEHDCEDDPIPEGMDAFGYEVDRHADDDDTEDYREDDEGDESGGDHPGGGGAGEALRDRPRDPEEDECFGPSSEDEPPADELPADVSHDIVAVAGHEEVGTVVGVGQDAGPGTSGPAGTSVADAREILIKEARIARDETTLRRLLQQRDKNRKDLKDASTPVALALHDTAAEKQKHWMEKRREAKDAAKKARLDVEVAAQRKAEALARHEELRLKHTQEQLQWRREEIARRQELEVWKAQQRWLQTEYPSALASQLVRSMAAREPRARATFVRSLQLMATQNWFRFIPRLPLLWEPDKSLLIRCGEVRPFDGHVPRSVRCAAAFDAYLDEVAPPGFGAAMKDPVHALHMLLEAVAPGSPRHVFHGPRRFLRFLHICDYVLDKTFVCCVLCLSKWLRPENWPEGVYEWPPAVPADVLPRQPILAAVEPAPLEDKDLSPRSRPSLPAASSGGTS